MNASESPPAALAPPPSLVAQLFRAGVRLALMAGILLTGWMLIQTYRELFGPTKGEVALPDSFDTHAGFAEDVWRPGAWTFGETTWALARRDVSAKDKDEAFTLTMPPSDTKRPTVEFEAEILAWLRQASKAQPMKNGQVYDMLLQGARLRVQTTGTGKEERLAFVQLGWSLTDEEWTLVEVKPTSAAAPLRNVHVMPLGDRGTSIARRWGKEERLSAELIRPKKDLDSLITSWQEQGWTVQSKQVVESGGVGVLLSRAGSYVQAWKLPIPGGPSEGCVLLIDLGRSSPEGKKR